LLAGAIGCSFGARAMHVALLAATHPPPSDGERAAAFAEQLAVCEQETVHAREACALMHPLPREPSSLNVGDLAPLLGIAPIGHAYVIAFAASDCPPCDELAIVLARLQRQAPDIAVAWIAETDAPADGVGLPVVLDTHHAIARSYDVVASPAVYFVDASGHVAFVHRGFRPDDETLLTQHTRALAGR
jgi:thiol-disulfide isomerase/thioredoxin